VLIPGVSRAAEPWPAELLDVLQEAHARGARIASICTGAFVLAAAGLLDGHRATTHWAYAAELAKRYPRVDVDASALYIDDGRVVTSAGVAAGLDLCLHLVRRDHGATVAANVARRVVMPAQRDGGQAQFITYEEPGDDNSSLEPTMHWARENLQLPLTIADIAGHAAMSSRTLNRRFKAQTGTTPLRWLIRQRLIRAQQLLETTKLPVEEVAEVAGFGSPVALRQHFARALETSPLAYRRAFQDPETRIALDSSL
jgi:transcriptional regulator GlxA family with amidase domain